MGRAKYWDGSKWAEMAPTAQEFDGHLVDDVKHITSSERLKWNQTSTDIGTKSSLLTTNKTNLVSAVNELFTNVSNGKQLVGTAITGVDNNLIVPTDATFQQLADLISNISTGRKWASGTSTASSMKLSVRGLEFYPKFIFVKFPGNNILNWYSSFYADMKSLGANANINFKMETSTAVENACTLFSDGFDMGVYVNAAHLWIAFE